MYNEKIAYYRKKNMLTQEELAEKIGVSRQTITKWEAGIISPSLEYLIDLSNIFGVTIDTLIKDDDCINDKFEKLNTDVLTCFIVKAKKSTYAAKKNKVTSSRKDSHDYIFKENDYKYYDSYFGSSSFSGQEIVYKNDKACWSMNYYGQALNHHFNGDFLKEALLQVSEENPYRGPKICIKGEYTYISNVVGDINSFNGDEKIYYQSQLIYECLFHGGIIK